VEGASPTPRPSATTSAKQLATAQALVTQASQKMKAADYEHAIGLLDKAIDAAPRYGNAYYLRASAGNLLTQHAEAAASEQPELYHYLGDINQALALDPPSGNYYLVRFHLEESLALVSPYRVDQDFWHTQALADIRQANALGNTEAYSDRQPPLVLANLGRCQEAQDQVNQLFKTKPQPSAALYSALAASDLCQKDAQSALKHIDAAISSQATTDRLLSRVVILYSLGRYGDARAQLDSTLKAHPGVCPCLYAWRALLDYKLGDSQMARGDLVAARKATPPTGAVGAYLQGLLALETGDKAGAVRFFQDAEAKLTRGDGPILLDEIRQQLAQAGAGPLAPTVSAPPTPAPRP
jgi:tetratricopeptide (TPR) repeat protein